MITSTTERWGVFISHASEDKSGFVQPLAELLTTFGLKVWYDELTLTLGDSLRRSIDKGLVQSRFGVVVISPDFIRKEWPQRELDALTAREIPGGKVILPIWHGVTKEDVLAFSPPLADRLAASSSAGLEKVAKQILRAVQAEAADEVAPPQTPRAELVALGPNIVCEGEILSAEPGAWRVLLDKFVEGDTGSVIRFAEDFGTMKPLDRYVILNILGDGRALTAAPSVTMDGNRTVLKCPVGTSAPRLAAQNLPGRLATSPKTNDIYIENGDLARVSGVSSLPQSLRESLSFIQGESMFARTEGSRLQEYYWRYRDTPHLESMLKIDVIRLAAIPYDDSKRPQPPLLCVERVWALKLLAEEPVAKRIPLRLDLEIKGLGRHEHEVSLLMPPADVVQAIKARPSQF
ncbi:toll/interleukin-1 receptor domain-containing protein [Burkholderia gladioli]|uniref:toll/interleukin-1 receptor domain-containing protein n=1 Tax=Burkholderia gladioli TaxID=28095 RepID=UPI00163E8898|nr:toll/interleukin-1 receptor domain-containing protein [Burkholderia gladioli]